MQRGMASALVTVALVLAGCSTPETGPNATAATVADFLPRSSELPPGFHAPQGGEHPDDALALETFLNGTNPSFREGGASAWYRVGDGHPAIFVAVDDVGSERVKARLPMLHVCAERPFEADRFLALRSGVVAHYMFEANQPEGSPERPERPAFDAMVEAIAARTGASDACTMQRNFYPQGWEEPNDVREQAVATRGYFDGLQVGQGGDVDWFRVDAGAWTLVHINVTGDGVEASVRHANGTVLEPGPGGWWLELPNADDKATLFVKVEGAGT